MKGQPAVAEWLESGERMYELPFSWMPPGQPGRVLRGTIDCLVRRPDGSIVIVEFKTGLPSTSHHDQLDIYLQAAQSLFPGVAVTGRVVYPR